MRAPQLGLQRPLNGVGFCSSKRCDGVHWDKRTIRFWARRPTASRAFTQSEAARTAYCCCAACLSRVEIFGEAKRAGLQSPLKLIRRRLIFGTRTTNEGSDDWPHRMGAT